MKTTQKPEAKEMVRALLAVADAVADIVKAGGKLGTPGGTLYAALMTHGCTLEQFEMLMKVLVDAGKLEKRGQLYFAKEGK
jgi:hypothetical protein